MPFAVRRAVLWCAVSCSDADSGDAEMVDEEHIGVNAIMGSKKRKKGEGEEGGDAPAAKEPKVCVQGGAGGWFRPKPET